MKRYDDIVEQLLKHMDGEMSEDQLSVLRDLVEVIIRINDGMDSATRYEQDERHVVSYLCNKYEDHPARLSKACMTTNGEFAWIEFCDALPQVTLDAFDQQPDRNDVIDQNSTVLRLIFSTERGLANVKKCVDALTEVWPEREQT